MTTELRELLAKATPGPWGAEAITKHSASNERPWVGRLSESRYAALSYGETQLEAVANAALIVAAVNALPALLDRVEALEAENARMREALASLLANFAEGDFISETRIEAARAALSDPAS